MKKKYKILFILLISLIILTVIATTNYKKYEKNYFYLDTIINIKINTNLPNHKVEEIFKEIESLYSTYHILADKYNKYDDVINVYYLNELLENDQPIEIEENLSKLINLGIEYYDITNGYINIASANLIDIWKKYIDLKEGIPSAEELNSVNIDITNLTLKDNIYTKKNDLKIDLGSFTKGYVTQLVGNYLESSNINDYIIDAGGNIKVGKPSKKDNYTVGITNPTDPNNIFTKLNVSNLSIVTSGDYQRYYEYNGIRYNHIINPYTKYPSNYFKSVTVITEDSFIADVYSTYLFLVDLDTGLEVINNTEGIEAIWYIEEDNIVKSNGFNF